MGRFHEVTPLFSVAGQLTTADVAAAADEGFRLVINNRPDGEGADQPPGAEIEAAAWGRGLDYMEIPVAGRPTPEQAKAMREAIAGHGGRAVAYCRTGTRSILTWALGEVAVGAKSRDEVRRLAAAASYDLSAMLPEDSDQ
jgi:uncharacterized protein (TIGR01244 family)